MDMVGTFSFVPFRAGSGRKHAAQSRVQSIANLGQNSLRCRHRDEFFSTLASRAA
jgi:hypothetical protein